LVFDAIASSKKDFKDTVKKRLDRSFKEGVKGLKINSSSSSATENNTRFLRREQLFGSVPSTSTEMPYYVTLRERLAWRIKELSTRGLDTRSNMTLTHVGGSLIVPDDSYKPFIGAVNTLYGGSVDRRVSLYSNAFPSPYAGNASPHFYSPNGGLTEDAAAEIAKGGDVFILTGMHSDITACLGKTFKDILGLYLLNRYHNSNRPAIIFIASRAVFSYPDVGMMSLYAQYLGTHMKYETYDFVYGEVTHLSEDSPKIILAWMNTPEETLSWLDFIRRMRENGFSSRIEKQANSPMKDSGIDAAERRILSRQSFSQNHWYAWRFNQSELAVIEEAVNATYALVSPHLRIGLSLCEQEIVSRDPLRVWTSPISFAAFDGRHKASFPDRNAHYIRIKVGMPKQQLFYVSAHEETHFLVTSARLKAIDDIEDIRDIDRFLTFLQEHQNMLAILCASQQFLHQ
jgi:hypothetical protein